MDMDPTILPPTQSNHDDRLPHAARARLKSRDPNGAKPGCRSGHWHGGTVDYHSSRLNGDFVMIHASKQAVNEGEQSSQLLGVIRAVVASISIIVLGWSQASTSDSYVYRRVSLLRKSRSLRTNRIKLEASLHPGQTRYERPQFGSEAERCAS